MERLAFWFQSNRMKVNPDKFHFLLMIKKHQVDICNDKLSSSCNEKPLEMKMDTKLSFEEHIDKLCKKPIKKSVRWQEFNH